MYGTFDTRELLILYSTGYIVTFFISVFQHQLEVVCMDLNVILNHQ